MSAELKEVKELVTADDDPVAKETIETAIQALLFHQVLYDDTPGVPRETLALIRREQDFFARYFNAAGFKLRVDGREQMVALEVKDRSYGWKQNRLRKDETLVRLALRLILDEGLKAGTMDDHGRVTSDTDEVVDMFRTLGQIDPPSEARLTEILTDLRRRGAVRIGDRDRSEKVSALTLLPGLRVHVPDSFIERVILWVEQGCPGDVFDFVAERRREETAAWASGGPERERPDNDDDRVDEDAA